jgi:hypothetical protein
MIDPVITFDKQAIREILYCFDKSIDDEGYVIDSDNKRVLAMDGKEIKASDIGGIIDGKFFRNDVCSLIEIMDARKQNDKI